MALLMWSKVVLKLLLIFAHIMILKQYHLLEVTPLVNTSIRLLQLMVKEHKSIWEPRTTQLLCQMLIKKIQSTPLLELVSAPQARDVWPFQSLY